MSGTQGTIRADFKYKNQFVLYREWKKSQIETGAGRRCRFYSNQHLRTFSFRIESSQKVWLRKCAFVSFLFVPRTAQRIGRKRGRVCWRSRIDWSISVLTLKDHACDARTTLTVKLSHTGIGSSFRSRTSLRLRALSLQPTLRYRARSIRC